ncbi:hypothetical protein LUZ60_012565 [Juncus effusus]|nr:hypothetical protein LUZ60_012565 [Juncus effusus]
MKSQESPSTNKPQVVLFPTPGMGHIGPMMHLGNLFAEQHGLSVTVLVLDPPYHSGPSNSSVISSSFPSLSFHHIPSISSLPSNPSKNHEYLTFSLLSLSNPNLRAALKSLSLTSPIHALILDLFCKDALDVARELSIPAFFFYTCNASNLACVLNHPVMDVGLTCSFKDMGNMPLPFPGIPDMPASDLPTTLQDRKDPVYECFLECSRKTMLATGILINTFESLEPRALAALRNGFCVPGRPAPPIYCIGPLIRGKSDRVQKRHDCLEWLDKQPQSSVVFLCFGSLGVFTVEQIKEIAKGIESSAQRFLWVVRVGEDPNRRGEKPVEMDLDLVLPEGFIERTRDRGLVVKNWAPQVDVLGHEAIGGFVTHCGWNSVLEGICAGIPMVAWPLYAEQRMNKVIMEEELRLAVGIEGYDKEIVPALEVEKKIRLLMESKEGEELRVRTLSAQADAKAALEEGGSSFGSLREVVDMWKFGEVAVENKLFLRPNLGGIGKGSHTLTTVGV